MPLRSSGRGSVFERMASAAPGRSVCAEILMTHEKLTSVLNQGGQHLGDLIWWTLAEARIDRSTLEKIWSDAQLTPEYLPDAPTAEKAFKTAARDAALGQSDRLVRVGKEDGTEIVFAVVRETKHVDGSISYQQETRVVLDRNSETLSSDVPGHDLAGVISSRFAELRSTHTPDDVRRAMMNVLASCATISLRDHGGVYWVPSPHAHLVRQLQAAIENVGSSRVYLLPVHASADANKTLGEAAVAALLAELNALKTEVEGFTASPPARSSTLFHRLDAFEELRGRAELYKQVLSVTVADLDETLTGLAASIEKLLNERPPA